jgi:hypothetical protein
MPDHKTCWNLQAQLRHLAEVRAFPAEQRFVFGIAISERKHVSHLAPLNGSHGLCERLPFQGR